MKKINISIDDIGGDCVNTLGHIVKCPNNLLKFINEVVV